MISLDTEIDLNFKNFSINLNSKSSFGFSIDAILNDFKRERVSGIAKELLST